MSNQRSIFRHNCGKSSSILGRDWKPQSGTSYMVAYDPFSRKHRVSVIFDEADKAHLQSLAKIGAVPT